MVAAVARDGGQFIPGWVIASVFSIFGAVIAFLAVVQSGLRERVARLEEHFRLREQDRTDDAER